MNIYFYPPSDEKNDYVKRMIGYLSEFCEVVCVDSAIDAAKKSFKNGRPNLIVINWPENSSVDKNGQIKLLALIKLAIKLLLFKLAAKKLVYFKHNFYPHKVSPVNKSIGKFVVSMTEFISDKVVVHNPCIADKYNHYYVPHPLYLLSGEVSDFKNIFSNYYVIFGRVERYKNIIDIIKVWPNNKNLIVAGSGDKNYAEEVHAEIRDRKNIVFMNKFIDNSTASYIIKKSSGVIIANREDSCLVSGTFFFSISCGKRVFCLKSEFYNWAKSQMGENIVVCEDLVDIVYNLDSKICDDGFMGLGYNLFGDIAIKNSLRGILE